jgi:signal transduction histidine kinase
VTTRIEDGFAVISIGDTGGGIPEAIRKRIFEPFFTTKEVGRGTGQGLSIAHNVIKAHGGKLDFVTELGKGTTFSVRLPLGDAEQESAVA